MFWDGVVGRLVTYWHAEGTLCSMPSDSITSQKKLIFWAWSQHKLKFKGLCHLTWALQITKFRKGLQAVNFVILIVDGWMVLIEDLYGTMCIFVLKNTIHTSKVPECLRSVHFWLIMQWEVVISYRRFGAIIGDGTDRLSRNISKKIPLLTAS